MRAMKITITLALLLAFVVGATAIAADEGGHKGGLKALGFKAYWSLLDEAQKDEAKEIIAEHLAATAPDRLAAAARFLTYKADVAALLTPEQRMKAGRIRTMMKRISKEKRLVIIDRLLDRTDRAALAERIDRVSSASPEVQVEVGIEILDQFHGALLGMLGERLDLTEAQQREITGLYEEMKADLLPIAHRLAKAKAEASRKGLALLDSEQRAKLDTVKITVMDKVLAFVRG